MDAKELKRRAAAARESSVTIGHVAWRIRAPQEVEVRSLVRANSGRNDTWDGVVRDIVPLAVIGWSGMKQGDLVAGLDGTEADAEAVFDIELAAGYLNARPEEFDQLTAAILEAYVDLKNKREATLKN